MAESPPPCKYATCEVDEVHGHGTDHRYSPRVSGYGEDWPYTTDKPGTLDALLFEAYLAGARAGQAERDPRLPGLRERFMRWRRNWVVAGDLRSL